MDGKVKDGMLDVLIVCVDLHRNFCWYPLLLLLKSVTVTSSLSHISISVYKNDSHLDPAMPKSSATTTCRFPGCAAKMVTGWGTLAWLLIPNGYFLLPAGPIASAGGRRRDAHESRTRRGYWLLVQCPCFRRAKGIRICCH